MREGVWFTWGMFLPQIRKIKGTIFSVWWIKLRGRVVLKTSHCGRAGEGTNMYSSSDPSEVQQKGLPVQPHPREPNHHSIKIKRHQLFTIWVISFWQSRNIPLFRCRRAYIKRWSRKQATAEGYVTRHVTSLRFTDTVAHAAELTCLLSPKTYLWLNTDEYMFICLKGRA